MTYVLIIWAHWGVRGWALTMDYPDRYSCEIAQEQYIEQSVRKPTTMCIPGETSK